MYTKYLYYSSNEISRGDTLIGARIIFEDHDKIRIQEIYVGEEYGIQEFIDLAPTLNVKSTSEFILERAMTFSSQRIIYFPNIKKFGYLEASDIVVPNALELKRIINSLTNEKSISLVRKKD